MQNELNWFGLIAMCLNRRDAQNLHRIEVFAGGRGFECSEFQIIIFREIVKILAQ